MGEMFKFLIERFRIINRGIDTTSEVIFDRGVLSPLKSSVHGTTRSFCCFSQFNSQSYCNTSLGALWIRKNNRKLNEVNSVRNVVNPVKYKIQQDIGSSNFHTSSFLNYKHEDSQSREKRSANLFIFMIFLALCVLLFGDYLIDLEEYDRPSAEKQ